MNQFGMLPSELRALRQWVLWKYVQREEGKDPTKPLFDAKTGGYARTHNSEDKQYTNKPEDTWSSFDETFKAFNRGKWSGIGYVFAEGDGYMGIDVDKCAVRGKVNPEALKVVQSLNSYTEFSPSRTGLHILVRADHPGPHHTKPFASGKIEMYDRARYFTMTGDLLDGTTPVIEDRQIEINCLYDAIFGETPKYAAPQARLDKTDSELLEIARKSKSRIFVPLYDYGDVSLYGGDDSRADLALCGEIAFYVGPDPSAIDRWFRGSVLYRPKWDRKDYSQRTIAKCLEGKTEFWSANGGRSYAGAAIKTRTVNQETGEITESDKPQFNRTEYGDSERMVSEHGEDIKFSSETKEWFVWDGFRWMGNQEEMIIERAKMTVRGMFQEGLTLTGTEKNEQLKHALKGEKAAHMRNMAFLAQSERKVLVTRNIFDADPLLLNCKNGTVNLRSGVLKAPDRADMITMSTGCEYDMDAECPLWLKFLDRILPDKAIREFMQRSCGYALTGDTGEQCFFFLHGEGANGKSTMIGALLAVMGDYGLQSVSDLLLAKKGDRVPVDIAELNKRRLVATIEIDDGRRMAEGLVKQMTGGDDMRARFLYKGLFQFTPTHKVFMAANHKPIIRGTDLAIWRRVMMVPFVETISDKEKDPKLGLKLKSEASGILNWCINGCLDWQTVGLKPPDSVRAAIDEYRAEQDIIGQFIEECCVCKSGRNIQAARLYEAYKEWCAKGGEHCLTNAAFGSEMTRRGFQVLPGRSYKLRAGIDLKGEGMDI